MTRTVSDAIVERLNAWGVHRLFGYPGDGINGFFAALERVNRATDDETSIRLQLIQVRHEEAAAFMACAHAKYAAHLGVCVATSGPGAIHLLNGLYDAKMDHAPVLAIVGQTKTTAMGGNYQQEVDLLSLFKDVAHEYVQMVTAPAQVPMVIDRAVRIALDRRTVTCVILPADVQDEPAVEEVPHAHHYVPGGLGYTPPRVIPPDDALDRAADILNTAERVAILIGAGARDAKDEVVAFAERVQGGVAKALLGKDVVADDLPFVTGSIGLLGTKPSYDMMTGCDALLVVGSSFPYSEYLPRPGQARGIQIDVDGTLIGIRYPMEVNLVGDSRETLRALLPRVQPKPRGDWRVFLEQEIERWWKIVADRAMQDADPINPQRVFHELSARLPPDCIITCDSGSTATWFARHLKLRDGMRASLAGGLATMGCGVPYAIAAKLAFPHKPVVAIVGDGAMQMIGNSELLTVSRYWRSWDDPRFIVLVVNNQDLNMVTWEMRVMSGIPKFSASQDLPDFEYGRYAELAGLRGIRLDRPDEVGPAWDAAFTADRPVVIDARCDPSVPPLPPHIEWQQARHMMSALLQGDPNALEVIRQSFRGKLEEFKVK